MINSNNISHFGKFVFRTPLRPLENFLSIKSEKELLSVFQDPEIVEAIYLASPEFYDVFKTCIEQEKTGDKKIIQSLYKYAVRLSARCTPFGLFAGVGMGIINDKETEIVLNTHSANVRKTRLDMNFLCTLTYFLVKHPSVRHQLLLYPNNSLYQVGDKMRYVDYKYTKKNKRQHQISSIDYNTVLEEIILFADGGKTFHQIVEAIIAANNIEIKDVEFYVNELLNEQVLISELDAQITGDDYLRHIIRVLEKIPDLQGLTNKLKEVNDLLIAIDCGKPNENLLLYEKIAENMNHLGFEFEKKNLFQTDFFYNTAQSVLNCETVNRISKTVEFLSKLSVPGNRNIRNFAQAFYNKYETKEIPLLIALDNELGLSYPNPNEGTGAPAPLLENLLFMGNDQKKNDLVLTPIDRMMLLKLTVADRQGVKNIELTDNDLKGLNLNKYGNLNPTFSALIEITKPNGTNNEDLIVLKSAGGHSSLSLIGRFCHLTDELYDLAKDTAQVEVKCMQDFIMAEIIHMPESRTGNILIHPRFFEYEIPYLASPSVQRDCIIPLSDLMISVRNNIVFLRSKKFNKIIVPRLSNAHNYSANAQPIYRFLCDMQSQNNQVGASFTWGALEYIFSHFPRVTYQGVVVSEEKWIIPTASLDKGLFSDSTDHHQKVGLWAKELGLPKYFKLSDGDNELLFDTENAFGIKIFFDIVKNRQSFVIKEYIHEPNAGIIKDMEGNIYQNQIIIPLTNSNISYD